MGCTYYYWNGGYACRKTGKNVDEDTYYKYCRNYDYGDCPIFKGNQDSGCFLTTACVEMKGLPDNCYELNTLRHFRDTYMKSTTTGVEDIKEYYSIAPQIITAIDKKKNSKKIYNDMYEELITHCIELINEGKNQEAYMFYREYVKRLKEQYLR